MKTPQPGRPDAHVRRIVRIMDLEDRHDVIAAYDHAHSVGETPAVLVEAQLRHGIAELQIYRVGHRLIMLMDVTEDFDPAGLEAERATNEIIDEWHIRMAQLQRSPLDDGQAWPEARRIFRQSDHLCEKEKP